KQTGQTSVDSFKQASNLRKQAADLGTQIENVKSQIIPLQMDLNVAQGQQAVVNSAIDGLQKQLQLLDEHWKSAQVQITVQQDLAKQITSASSNAPATQPEAAPITAGKSIAEKAAVLAQLITQTDALRDQAVDTLTAAPTSFHQHADQCNQFCAHDNGTGEADGTVGMDRTDLRAVESHTGGAACRKCRQGQGI